MDSRYVHGSSASRGSVPGFSAGVLPLGDDARGILVSPSSGPGGVLEGIGLDEDVAASSSTLILSPGFRKSPASVAVPCCPSTSASSELLARVDFSGSCTAVPDVLSDAGISKVSALDLGSHQKAIFSECCIQSKSSLVLSDSAVCSALGARPAHPGVACTSVSLSPNAILSPKLGSLLPQKSHKLLISSDYPVLSARPGVTVGLSSASTGAALVPGVPGPPHLAVCSNFEFSKSNFPPLQHSSIPPVSPPCAAPQMVTSGPSREADVDKCKSSSDWASLVKEVSASMQLKYIKPLSSASEGKVTIKIPSEVALKGASIWKNTMVGFFLDKLPFSLVQSTAMRHWGKLGLLNVLCNGNGFFFFKFSDSASLYEALEGGPWYFGGRPIFLRRWSPGLNLSKEGCKRVPIWAHFYNVPLEYWTEEGLSYIASMVGKPLHADKTTSSLRRLSYARICIEIDIEASLPSAFDIEQEDGSFAAIQIVYNWIPKRCSVCKEFGHLSSNCKKVSHPVWIPKPSPATLNPLSDGDWKFVGKQCREDPIGLSSPSKALHVSPSKGQPVSPSKVQADSRINASSKCFSAVRGLRCSGNKFEALRLDGEPIPVVDPIGSGVEDPIAVADPTGEGVGDPIAAGDPLAGDPIGEGVDDPIAADDPIAGDPTFDDPNASVVPMACSSVSPAGDSSISALSPPIIGCEVSSPSSSLSSTPLLARRLIMIDEVEEKLGRKKKVKKKNGSSGNSRGKLSLNSK